MNFPAKRPLRSLEEALAEVLAAAQPLPSEAVPTLQADSRVLAQDLLAPLDVPGFDNSAMDGFALISADVGAPSALLPISQRIAAGQFGVPLAAGTAARIFTGAPLPPGADAVLMQEDTEITADGQLKVNAKPAPGQWVRRRGEDIAKGSVALRAGQRLSPAQLGLAASLGAATVHVARAPRVALFSTGDELVMPGTLAPHEMPPGAIYNSNRFFLHAMLRRCGAVVTDLGLVPDTRQATQDALQQAAIGHDLVLTSGGVSVGEEDHVKPAVEALGGLSLWQISMKPGKPFAVGHLKTGGGSAHFIGLPGNPVSSWVTFLLLVRPFLLRLQGAADVEPRALMLPAAQAWPKVDKRREFLRAQATADGVVFFANQNSSVLSSAAWANGLVDLPVNTAVGKGDMVRFLPLEGIGS